MRTSDSIKLHLLGLPVIQNMTDLSRCIHVSNGTIYQLSTHADKRYKVYSIAKKNGKPRVISQPGRKLKALQSWILVRILNQLKVSDSCKGFEKKSSTLDNALPHKGAETVLIMDLKDFFPTITSRQVYSIFKAIGYNNLIATIFTNICTFEGTLPQGSPCSPKLANLTALKLDLRIQGYVRQKSITYTRYADDLSFSGLIASKVIKIIPMLKTIIGDEGFVVNDSKTRIAASSRQKKITGLVLSGAKIGIGQQLYKRIRAKMHHLTLPGEQNNLRLLNEVKGWLSYFNSVDKASLIKAKRYSLDLSHKNPGTLITQLYQISASEKSVAKGIVYEY